MGLRELLKKKDDLGHGAPAEAATVDRLQTAPEFTFIRSDTTSEERIFPPTDPANDKLLAAKQPRKSPRRSLDVFRSNSSRSISASPVSPGAQKGSRRLSERLHLHRTPASSENVPDDLPEIVVPSDAQDQESAELQWEKRATMLAEQNEVARSQASSPGPSDAMAAMGLESQRRTPSPARSKAVSTKGIDADIQEAIRLHEEGDLERSTEIFGHLADPNGANNPLSQVLYGLALR